jgi:hypothetical protein
MLQSHLRRVNHRDFKLKLITHRHHEARWNQLFFVGYPFDTLENLTPHLLKRQQRFEH